MLLSSLLLAVLGWCGLSVWVDRASIPIWWARTAWKLASFLLLLGLAFLIPKALLWHQELTLLIRSCP